MKKIQNDDTGYNTQMPGPCPIKHNSMRELPAPVPRLNPKMPPNPESFVNESKKSKSVNKSERKFVSRRKFDSHSKDIGNAKRFVISC